MGFCIFRVGLILSAALIFLSACNATRLSGFFPGSSSNSSTSTSTALTFTGLYPSMMGTIGSFGALYTQPSMLKSSATPVAGDRVENITVPDGSVFQIVVKVPVPKNGLTYQVPAYSSGNVSDYFTQAVSFALTNNYSRVQFPKASYQFQAPAAGADNLPFANVDDLIIDGQGSTLNFVGISFGVTFTNCQRVEFENFNIDWPTLQFAGLGTITSLDSSANTALITVDSAYPISASTTLIAVTSWDRVNNQWSLLHPNHEVYLSTTNYSYNGAQQMTIPNNGFAVGESVLLRFVENGSAVHVNDSQDFGLDNINIFSGPGMGFFFSGGRGYRLSNSSDNRTANRPISTNADAIHISDNQGDIIIENSTFAYQGDDGLNINSQIASYTAGETPSVPNWGAQVWSTGNTMAFFSETFGFLSTATLTSTTLVNPTNPNGTYDVTFSSSVPQNTAIFGDLSYFSPRYLINNNHFLNNRARGALLQTAYGQISNNTFSGQTMYSLYMVASTYWGEGPGAQNILVNNNTFENNGNESQGGNASLGAIVMATENTSGATTAVTQPVHQNIIFSQNTISNTPGPGFFVTSANNVILDRNIITNTNSVSTPVTPYGTASSSGSVVMTSVNNVFYTGNVLSGTSGPISIDTKTTSGIASN